MVQEAIIHVVFTKKSLSDTVRTLLERMEEKGWITHHEDGRTFLYSAAQIRYHGRDRPDEFRADIAATDDAPVTRERSGPCPNRPGRRTRTRAPSGSLSTTATPSFALAGSPTWSAGKRRRPNWSCPPSSPTGSCSFGVPGAIAPSRTWSRLRPYPELRAAEQALRDLLLVYLVRNEVPNVLVLVLRPKGQLHVPDHARRPSSDGVTELGGAGGGSSSCGQFRPSRCWRRRTRG